MSGFPILDLVIGMIFIFFLLSIICSSAVELWFSLMKTRAKLMQEWLTRIFNSPALDSSGNPINVSVGQEIMNHCMVTALSKTSKSPSYISADNFVSALLDKITITNAVTSPPQAVTPDGVQLPPSSLAAYITAIQNSTVISGELKRTILSFAYQAQAAAQVLNTIPQVQNITATVTSDIKSDIDDFRARLANWYSSNSDRLTGAFKRRKALPATLIFGVLLTIGLNVDSVAISKYLYSHPDVSKQFADQALVEFQQKKDRVEVIRRRMKDSAVAKSDSAIDLVKEKDTLVNDINNLSAVIPQNLPMGWDKEDYNWKQAFGNSLKTVITLHGMGWAATVLAICLGAPFWFDILNKISNLRSTGPKPAPPGNDDK